MRYILIIFAAVCFLLPSCEDHQVGYLSTEYAKYSPDTLLVEKDIDDANRLKFNIPWLSLPMEGVEGTAPIMFSIKEVKSNTSINIDEFLKYVNVRGNGIFEVDLDHQLLSGRYLITLQAKNEGHTHLIPDIFTIIVE